MARKKSAAKDELQALHAEFAKKLAKYLKEGETQIIAGKEHKTSCSAAMMNVIRTFLKDNNVECGQGEETAAVGSLRQQMTEFDKLAAYDEEEAPRFEN